MVDVFSPLVRAPGGAAIKDGARQAAHNNANGQGRRLLLNRTAGLHTASRTHGANGFSNLRPQAVPRSTNQVGLGSARNFSSSRTVFENVVNNAPLGLRVFGDDEFLDMRALKRDMKQACLKQQKQEAHMGKGKGRLVDSMNTASSFLRFKSKRTPSHIDEYFPIDMQALALNKPSVQLLLPIAPAQDKAYFLSINEEAEDSRFFSAMLMSDLRLLHDMYGRHHARMRNIIQKLEHAGSFEVDESTGQSSVRAVLDEDRGCIVVTFFGERWTMADVRQVLGYYQTGPTPWFELVDLGETSVSSEQDDVQSLPSSLPSEFGEGNHPSRPESEASQLDFTVNEVAEYERINQSLQMPCLSSELLAQDAGASTTADSYVLGVEDFLSQIDANPRPTFL